MENRTRAQDISKQLVTGCFILAGLLLSASVQADPPAANAPMFKWADTTQYQNCSFDCLPDKGNENISLQSTYIVRKLQGLQQDWDAANRSGDPSAIDQADQEIKTALSRWCLPNEKGGTCLKRVTAFEIRSLKTEYARAIGENNSTIASLAAARPDGTTAKIIAPSVDLDANKKPQVAQIPTYQELRQQYQDKINDIRASAQERNYEEMEAQKQAAEFANPPLPKDYANYLPATRDPSNPNASSLHVVDRSPGAFDQKAYQSALTKYNPKAYRADSKKLAEAFQRNLKPIATGKERSFDQAVDDRSYRAFEAARKMLIKPVRENMEASGLVDHTSDFLSKLRKPAGGDKSDKSKDTQIAPPMPTDGAVDIHASNVTQRSLGHRRNPGKVDRTAAEDQVPDAIAEPRVQRFFTVSWDPKDLIDTVDQTINPP